MNENPLADLSTATEERLPDDDTVYRAALEVTWFSPDKQEVDAAAFYRRKGIDNDGISIGATQFAYREYLHNPIDGIIRVSVGCVRNITDPELQQTLDVIIDDYPHGVIVNVPFKEKKGPKRRLADRIASLIARNCARVHEVFDPPHN
jgi:hypothetical protein